MTTTTEYFGGCPECGQTAEPTEEERRRIARLASADQIDQDYGVQMGPGDTMRALSPEDNPFDPDPGAAT